MCQRHNHFNIVGGEVSRLSVDAALKPVLVDLTDQSNDVTLAEAQFSIILWLKVIQGFTTWLGCRETNKRVTTRRTEKENMLSFLEKHIPLSRLVGILSLNKDFIRGRVAGMTHTREAYTTEYVYKLVKLNYINSF